MFSNRLRTLIVVSSILATSAITVIFMISGYNIKRWVFSHHNQTQGQVFHTCVTDRQLKPGKHVSTASSVPLLQTSRLTLSTQQLLVVLANRTVILKVINRFFDHNIDNLIEKYISYCFAVC